MYAQFEDVTEEVEPRAAVEPFKIIRPVKWQGLPVPVRRWHVKDWIRDAVVAALYGDGGTGKSLLAQQLLTATAIGKPWLGLETKQCRAIGFFCEDVEDELHIRQADINQMYGCEMRDLGDMEMVSRVNLDNILMAFMRDGKAQATEVFHEMLRWAKDFGAGFAVVDTAADTYGGDENDRMQVRLFIQTCLGTLAREINGSVLLCAHPSRSGLTSGRGDGGSTAWSNSVRSRLYLSFPESEDGAEPDRSARILQLPKTNYSATGDSMRLRWLDGTLRVDPRVDGATPGTLGNIERKRCEQVFLELLRKGTEDGRTFSDSIHSANRFAPKAMAMMEGRHGFTRLDFQHAMERLFAQQRIECVVRNRFGSTKIVERDPPERELDDLDRLAMGLV